MLTFQTMTFSELYATKGFQEWVDEYIEETAHPDIGAAQAQIDRYEELEAKGQLRCIAITDDGLLVGGAVLLVTQSQHYPFPLVAVESFYLRKDWRRGSTGLHLLGGVKAVAAHEGAPGFTFMAPPGGPLDRLCHLRGMRHTHNTYWCKCDE